MKSYFLLVVLFFYMLSARAGQQPLVTISDPSGDDNGAGQLTYPQRTDFQSGDLDLLLFKISRDEEGFWFTATFKNKIRDPKEATNTVGPETLANFARKGFYQFNIDIYVDIDRANGSGNTFTLPGRKVRIDSHFAWEKAVILTPRPELMRQQLLGALAEQFPARSSIEIEDSIDQSVLFPTRIRVHGKAIDFFVPARFFAGSNGSDWGITAFVTGAITTIPLDMSLTNSKSKPLDRLQLGVMQPASGLPKDTFGYSGITPSPVVDLLAVSGEQQLQQLSGNNNLTGVAWGNHANENAILISTATSSVLATAGNATETSVSPIGKFLQPDMEGSEQPSSVIKLIQTNPPDEAVIAKRLQILQRLFDQKLIDETEYKQQKQRILQQL